ncbi:MAG: hypothetical protein ACI4F4_07865 [Lachnospiraceae bacterium]
MDDYRKIQSQIKYTVQYAPYANTEKPNYKENLTGDKSYKATYKFMIILLVVSGIGMVASIITGIVFSHNPVSDFERKFMAIMIFITSGAFLVSLLIGGFGSFMELHTEKKDRAVTITLDSKTWILHNGRVVISDEQKFRSVQQYDTKTRLPIAEAPFKKLIIIQRVYSITRAEGKIIVDADIIELYRKHPYTDEGITRNEEDNADRFYYYCQRDRRDKVIWYENMYGRELLLQALNQLTQS